MLRKTPALINSFIFTLVRNKTLALCSKLVVLIIKMLINSRFILNLITEKPLVVWVSLALKTEIERSPQQKLFSNPKIKMHTRRRHLAAITRKI
jgi:hypothetical protein